ncbi:MAG: hypothetical protein JNK05_07025 [Myxococcales bacterium]|nr:hypothetical protein [Myxococcales bacterium]
MVSRAILDAGVERRPEDASATACDDASALAANGIVPFEAIQSFALIEQETREGAHWFGPMRVQETNPRQPRLGTERRFTQGATRVERRCGRLVARNDALLGPIANWWPCGGGFCFRVGDDLLYRAETFLGPIAFAGRAPANTLSIGRGWLSNRGELFWPDARGRLQSLRPSRVVAASAVSDDRIAIVEEDGEALVSSDGGQRWTRVALDEPAIDAATIDDDLVFVTRTRRLRVTASNATRETPQPRVFDEGSEEVEYTQSDRRRYTNELLYPRNGGPNSRCAAAVPFHGRGNRNECEWGTEEALVRCGSPGVIERGERVGRVPAGVEVFDILPDGRGIAAGVDPWNVWSTTDGGRHWARIDSVAIVPGARPQDNSIGSCGILAIHPCVQCDPQRCSVHWYSYGSAVFVGRPPFRVHPEHPPARELPKITLEAQARIELYGEKPLWRCATREGEIERVYGGRLLRASPVASATPQTLRIEWRSEPRGAWRSGTVADPSITEAVRVLAATDRFVLFVDRRARRGERLWTFDGTTLTSIDSPIDSLHFMFATTTTASGATFVVIGDVPELGRWCRALWFSPSGTLTHSRWLPMRSGADGTAIVRLRTRGESIEVILERGDRWSVWGPTGPNTIERNPGQLSMQPCATAGHPSDERLTNWIRFPFPRDYSAPSWVTRRRDGEQWCVERLFAPWDGIEGTIRRDGRVRFTYEGHRPFTCQRIESTAD